MNAVLSNTRLLYQDTPSEILKKISALTGISEKDIQSKSKKKEFVIARQLWCYYSRFIWKSRLIDEDIATQIGATRSNLIGSYQKIENLLNTGGKKYANKIYITYCEQLSPSDLDLESNQLITLVNLSYIITEIQESCLEKIKNVLIKSEKSGYNGLYDQSLIRCTKDLAKKLKISLAQKVQNELHYNSNPDELLNKILEYTKLKKPITNFESICVK